MQWYQPTVSLVASWSVLAGNASQHTQCSSAAPSITGSDGACDAGTATAPCPARASTRTLPHQHQTSTSRLLAATSCAAASYKAFFELAPARYLAPSAATDLADRPRPTRSEANSWCSGGSPSAGPLLSCQPSTTTVTSPCTSGRSAGQLHAEKLWTQLSSGRLSHQAG